MMTTETEDGEKNECRADKVLVAVGCSPITNTMDIENAGLEAGDRDFFSVGDHRRADVKHIYVIGGMVEDTPMLAHVASKEDVIAAEHVTGEPVTFDSQTAPATVFADPEIGTVDVTEIDVEETGFTPAVGQMPLRASDCALMTNRANGFVRVVTDGESGFVLGTQIIGPEASGLIAEFAFAIKMDVALRDVTSAIHAHPTLAEVAMKVTEDALGQAVHTLNR